MRKYRKTLAMANEALLPESTAELVLRLLLSALFAVAVPVLLATSFDNEFTLPDEVVIGLLVGISGLMLQMVYQLKAIQHARLQQVQLADVRTDLAVKLADIRKHLDELALQRNHLFVAYFDRELERLRSALNRAAHHYELAVDQDSDTFDMMLTALSHCEDRVIRAVHFLDANAFLLDVHARSFFSDVYDAVGSNRVHEVRRLMITLSEDDRKTSSTRRLVGFHLSNHGYDCRILGQDDFLKIARDFRVEGTRPDFGIYGGQFMYLSHVAKAGTVSGAFTVDSGAISQYTALFDRCWDSTFAESPRLKDGKDVDVIGLFRPDGEPHR